MMVYRWIGWQGLASACLGAVLAGLIWVSHDRALAREREKVRVLKQEIAKLEPQVAEFRPLRGAIQELLARKQLVEYLCGSRYAVPLFEELASRRPQGVYLTALRDDRRRFFITGYAASEREASAFLANLGDSALLQEAQLLKAQADAAPRLAAYPLRFTISAKLKDRK
jgi:type IV pilus assembly protein PilN